MLPVLQKREKLFFSKDYFGKQFWNDCNSTDKYAINIQLWEGSVSPAHVRHGTSFFILIYSI